MILQKDFTDIIVNLLPADVKKLLTLLGGVVCVAGDYCREVLRGNEPTELEIFAISEEAQKKARSHFADEWNWVSQVNTGGCQIFHHISEPLPAVKFSTATYDSVIGLREHFDFSVQQVGVYWSAGNDQWVGSASEMFWRDLIGQVAHFTEPKDGDPARSVVNMMRLAELGFHIPLEDVAKVIAQFVNRLPGTSIGEIHRALLAAV